MVSLPDFDDVDWPKTLLFYSMHVACLDVFWAGVSGNAIGLCAALYVSRMFAITGGYQRLFAHRSYRTSHAALRSGVGLLAAGAGSRHTRRIPSSERMARVEPWPLITLRPRHGVPMTIERRTLGVLPAAV
jgi:hypothetical protein